MVLPQQCERCEGTGVDETHCYNVKCPICEGTGLK